MIKSFLRFLKSKDFKEFILFNIFSAIIIFICMLIFKFSVSASGTESQAYFPMEQNVNNKIPQNVITYLDNNIGQNNYYVCNGSYSVGTYSEFYVAYWSKSDSYNCYGEISSNGYQWTLYKVGNFNVTYGKIQIKTNQLQTAVPSGINVGQYQFYFNNRNSSLYDSSISFVSNYRVLTNNTSSGTTVLKYGWELPPDFMHDTSHATPPDAFESPLYTTGHTPPTNVPPTYTINNYSWTTYTPPTVDTSNAETLLESIYNAIVYNGQYLKDNIHGELTNLVNNIGGYFDFIGDTIQYYGNLIISNIQNGITTFYNNINSAIVGIGNAVGYITQPLDMDNLTNAVNSTHIWGDVDTCTTFASDAFGIYGTVAEPNSFKIPLDLRSISLLNITQVYYIDLSLLDGAKQAIRAFMWCVVTFGLLYSVIVDIPNMIRSSK